MSPGGQMARLKLELNVPAATLDDLKELVHERDEELSGEGNGIAVENVSTLDIVTTLVVEDSYAYEVVDEPTEKSKLEKLGQQLNDIMMNPEAGPLNVTRMKSLNAEVFDMARKQSGVSAADVADENMENDPRVLHYWSLTSSLMAKVYMSAAQQLHYVEGWM